MTTYARDARKPFFFKTCKAHSKTIRKEKELGKGHKCIGKRGDGGGHETTGGMTAVCGRGICHILSSDRTRERYSIASAVLGSHRYTSTRTHTQESRSSQAYLALHGCAASMQSCRSCQLRPGSFWTVSLNAMSLPVMEWCSHSHHLPWDGEAYLIGMEKCVFVQVTAFPHVFVTKTGLMKAGRDRGKGYSSGCGNRMDGAERWNWH